MALFHEKVAGVDIGDRCVAAAITGIARDGTVTLRRVGCQSFDPADGEDGIVRAIRSVWRKHGFTTQTVASCLRSRALWLKYFHFPELPEHQITSALELEAESSLQLPAGKLAIDWHRNVAGIPRDGVEGALAAAPRKEILRHRRLLERSGLYPIIIDVGCTAVCNLYLQLRGAPPDSEVVCLVNLLHRTADVSVLFGGRAIYPRTLVSRSNSWDATRADLLGRIRDELRFYEHKLGHPPVTRMVLLGHTGSSDEGRALFEEHFRVPCERWDPLDELRPLGRAKKSLSTMGARGGRLATCLGLSLRRGDDD